MRAAHVASLVTAFESATHTGISKVGAINLAANSGKVCSNDGYLDIAIVCVCLFAFAP